MMRKLYHPLWVHLPAAVALLVLGIAVVRAVPLPGTAPLHFAVPGQPDRWGSPWQVLGMVIGLSIFFIGLSVFLDDLWGRQESHKTFNWMSLIDEITVGLMCGMAFDYLRMLSTHDCTFSFPWHTILLFTGCAVAAGIALEIIRPYVPGPGQVAAGDAREFEAQVAELAKSGQAWAFWQEQNPPYNTALAAAATLVLATAAALSWPTAPWASLLMLVSAAATMIMYGGLRVSVTPERLVLRLGILGIRLLNLKCADITNVDVHEFSPLQDFGGYGIRLGRGTKAYFLRGNRGVKLTTARNKTYLIGSDHPDCLAAAIRVAAAR